MSITKLLVGICMCFAVIATLWGMRILIGFDQTAGAMGVAPARWPAPSEIPRDPARPQLLVFVHPFCPCSAATLEELERMTARRTRTSVQPQMTVLFVRPRGAKGWRSAGLWDTARQLAGAHVMWDEDGQEAHRFGALTSGDILLYEAHGILLFHGGVTGSRGHAGDNYGADELTLALDSGRPVRAPQMVFGCSLAGVGLLAPARE